MGTAHERPMFQESGYKGSSRSGCAMLYFCATEVACVECRVVGLKIPALPRPRRSWMLLVCGHRAYRKHLGTKHRRLP